MKVTEVAVKVMVVVVKLEVVAVAIVVLTEDPKDSSKLKMMMAAPDIVPIPSLSSPGCRIGAYFILIQSLDDNGRQLGPLKATDLLSTISIVVFCIVSPEDPRAYVSNVKNVSSHTTYVYSPLTHYN